MTSERDRELVAWILGQSSGADAEATRRRVESDPRAALQAAETRALLEDLRELRAEPSGRVAVAVRYAMRRRAELRGRERSPTALGSEVRTCLRLLAAPSSAVRVVAVAAAVVVALLFVQPPEPERTRMAATPALRSTEPVRSSPGAAVPHRAAIPDADGVLAAAGPALARHHRRLQALAPSDVFSRLLRANNDLALLRLEFVQRLSAQARLRSIRVSGGPPELEDRIQAIAGDLERELRAGLAAGEIDVVDVALGLRALLASGSTLDRGHHEAVAAALADLERRIDGAQGGALASVLAALTDLAVVANGETASLVAEHADRLAWETLVPPLPRPSHDGSADLPPADRARPPLLRFTTPSASLADAGHVLRLAPAFGVHPLLAHRARLLVAAHVEERLAGSPGDRPELLAAQLYGFGDLVDRNALDDRLRLWRPSLLAVEDPVALHHLLWSQFPVRPGWARFQRDLRELATLETPGSIGGASALLLSLSMNFAAPGVHEILLLAG